MTLRQTVVPCGFLLPLVFLVSLTARAQNATAYQTPPKALADLVTVPPTPGVMTGNGDVMLILEQASAPTIAELAQPELKLAGLRINPLNNGPSRVNYITGLKLKQLPGGTDVAVKGLPSSRDGGPALISYVQWSPDESRFAFTVSGETGIELYVADVATATATRVTNRLVNATFGTPFQWLSDSKGLIVKLIPEGRGPAMAPSRVPVGPTT